MATVEDNESWDFAPDFPLQDLETRFGETNKEIGLKYKIKRFRFALSRTQRDDLLRTAAENSRRHELILETQMRTGLRVGELVNLRIQDVNLGEKTIYIVQHEKDDYCTPWHPKSAAGIRIVPVDADLYTKLRGYLKDEKRTRGFLFPSQKSPKYNERAYINLVNKYAKNTRTIGHNIGSHSLRRTYASHLINENVSIGIISQALGHSSIEITMRYLFHVESLENHQIIRDAMKNLLKNEPRKNGKDL